MMYDSEEIVLLAIARRHCSASADPGVLDALRAAFEAGRSAECADWVERLEHPASPEWLQRSQEARAAYRAVAGDEAGSFEERMLDEARMPEQVARVAYQAFRTAEFWNWLAAMYVGGSKAVR
jgi:hypothetical protein